MCGGRRWEEDGPGSSGQKPLCAHLEIHPSGKGKGNKRHELQLENGLLLRIS